MSIIAFTIKLRLHIGCDPIEITKFSGSHIRYRNLTRIVRYQYSVSSQIIIRDSSGCSRDSGLFSAECRLCGRTDGLIGIRGIIDVTKADIGWRDTDITCPISTLITTFDSCNGILLRTNFDPIEFLFIVSSHQTVSSLRNYSIRSVLSGYSTGITITFGICDSRSTCRQSCDGIGLGLVGFTCFYKTVSISFHLRIYLVHISILYGNIVLIRTSRFGQSIISGICSHCPTSPLVIHHLTFE